MEAGPGECGQLRASNVFLLTSGARDKVFPQGRCFLSAETLTEMRGWVADIQRILASRLSAADRDYISKRGHIFSREQEDKSRTRSGSFDTLQSVKTQSRLNTSCPAQTVGRPIQKSASPQCWGLTGQGRQGQVEADTDLNLTYSYSEDEEEARPRDLVTCPRSPRSVDTSLRRRVLDKTKHLAFIDSSEEDLTRLEDCAGLGNRTASDETQSYATVVKMMETVKQQSENLGDLFRQDDTDSPPPGPPGLQERMEAVTQTVQRLETQAATVIQVRQGIWVT